MQWEFGYSNKDKGGREFLPVAPAGEAQTMQVGYCLVSYE